ncbi:glycoside hydrolase family 3 N-terminal domain-containing protein [Vibrio tapetis]|uniref:beta-glucosidase n=1 Tax=Vibrio tapetis subsp. tapetis TaxID=1671868 RepID=A0A2N8ZMT7_9VIBR|nr:glycoside hydrolase family 3 N-terminal domain-containing protein [Vibrio tapetis]SON53230.1 Periplasmic beta-glucosidase [Vibrio tapetis subsp. tapetis]
MTSYQSPDLSIEQRSANLLEMMTVAEKVGQLCQSPMLEYRHNRDEYLAAVKTGRVGSRILADTAWAGNTPGETVDPLQLNEIQRAAVEESRLGIPIIFARDVIYGQKTVLPIPLAQACSWNPKLVEQAYSGIAREAASLGINWTFAPMLDIVRDPRWGRVIESSGEDPFVASTLAQAVVKGFQGDDPSKPDRLLACAKHFIGYGAAEGGRDYDTTEITDNTLHNVYLPSFKAAVDAGVATLMSGFNDLGGTPVTACRALIRDWLKEQQKFDGVVVSDWGSISDLAYFGVANDESEAAKQALLAGVDIAMTNKAYEGVLDALVIDDPKLMKYLDDAVLRVLKAKFRAGLFESPYVDPKLHQTVLGHPQHQQWARELAQQSMVLLKNQSQILPLPNEGLKIAVIGPHAHSQRQHLGSWCLDGDSRDVVSIYEGIKLHGGINTIMTEDSTFSDEMVECAHLADVVVLCVGESHRRTGEARNIAELTLPAGQEDLIHAVGRTGKPLIVVQCTGRPVPSPATEQHANALLYAWQSGTETGRVVADLLFGDVSPSGKLTMTVPRTTGQIPMYYARKPVGKMRDFREYQAYKDFDCSPLYPFGFGLTYSQFHYDDLSAAKQNDGSLRVVVRLTNTGSVQASEVVQCYLAHSHASTTRPSRELKAFARVCLSAGENEKVVMNISAEQLIHYGADKKWRLESGKITLFVGSDSTCGLSTSVDV